MPHPFNPVPPPDFPAIGGRTPGLTPGFNPNVPHPLDPQQDPFSGGLLDFLFSAVANAAAEEAQPDPVQQALELAQKRKEALDKEAAKDEKSFLEKLQELINAIPNRIRKATEENSQ